MTLRSAPLLLLLLALGAAPASAQEVPLPDTVPAAPVPRADTLAGVDTVRVDTVREGITPKGAFLRSLVLPGWGQSAVGAPGRGAVYFALESGSLWMLYKSRRKLGEARELERTLRESGELAERQTLGLVDTREEQVEDWITLSAFWLLFSAADAFVSAYLADFDERIGVGPAPAGGLRMEASIPVGRRP